MTVLALAVSAVDVADAGWIHGLELVSVPVVTLAVLSMRRSLAPDAPRLALAVAGAVVALAWSGFGGQVAAILLGAAVGVVVLRRPAQPPDTIERPPGRPFLPLASLAVFAALLLGLPAVLERGDDGVVALVDAMFRSGALVFGGGHVVLPLLHDAVVAPGWVGEQEFLAGYGLVQAMPGPLFTFSAYLGAVRHPDPSGIAGAAVALAAIFLPSFLLLGGILPLWAFVRRHAVVQSALAGVGAAVVGVLAAALWNPVLTTSVDGVGDLFFATGLLVLLRILPVWAVVPLAAAAGALAF